MLLHKGKLSPISILLLDVSNSSNCILLHFIYA